MGDGTVEGLADAYATIERIPNAAQYEFADMLGKLGRDILAAQRARVPRQTGTLAAGLSAQLEVESYVRLRVGLLGAPATSKSAFRRWQQRGGSEPRNLGDVYYGRFVEFGVSAQTVVVQRRRRVDGQLRTRRGRKRVEDIVKTYSLRVPQQQARPFVNLPDPELDALPAQRTADFWARTLDRADD